MKKRNIKKKEKVKKRGESEEKRGKEGKVKKRGESEEKRGK